MVRQVYPERSRRAHRNRVRILAVAAAIVVAAAALTLTLAVFVFRDQAARLVWRVSLPELALLLDRSDAALALTVGNYYFGGGTYNLDAAVRAFRKAWDIDEGLLGPRYQLARIAFLKGDFSGALALINEELALHPGFKRSYYVRGLIYGYIENYELAARDFKEFLAWNPKSWAGWNDLAWVYFASGDFALAEEAARSGLEYSPVNPWLLLSRGTALLNLEKKNEAEEVLTRAQAAARALTPADWGRAYPGNDPTSYPKGLEEMQNVIERNITLAREE
ncbi:MAG: hypothetical protein Q8Q41_01645 [bacterium]|nr:hypothetical protein [bacterium]